MALAVVADGKLETATSVAGLMWLVRTAVAEDALPLAALAVTMDAGVVAEMMETGWERCMQALQPYASA